MRMVGIWATKVVVLKTSKLNRGQIGLFVVIIVFAYAMKPTGHQIDISVYVMLSPIFNRISKIYSIINQLFLNTKY